MATSDFVRDVTDARPPLSLSRNPIKTALLFYEMLQRLKTHFSLFKDCIEEEQE